MAEARPPAFRSQSHKKESMLGIFKSRQRTPQSLEDLAERILNLQDRGLDVDGHPKADPRDPKVQDLHIRTFSFGLPEEWMRLKQAKAHCAESAKGGDGPGRKHLGPPLLGGGAHATPATIFS